MVATPATSATREKPPLPSLPIPCSPSRPPIAANVQRGSSRTDVVGIWDHGSCRRCAVKVPFRGVPVESRRMILNA